MTKLTSLRWYLVKLKKYLPKSLHPVKTPRQLQKQRNRDKDYPRPTAFLLAYYGKNYHGLNFSWEVPTVEKELLKALHSVGVGFPVEAKIQRLTGLQRVSRTDKGVSAAANIVLAKMTWNVDNTLEKVNEVLPADIRVIDCVKAPRNFHDHKLCEQRTYTYTIPTYAFAPLEETVTLGYRTNLDIIERVNEVLEQYWHSHSFHCFTVHRETLTKNPRRYIYDFECGMPFVRDGVEFCVIRIRGESFMMHQIRKMIGLMIAIVKGYCDIETIQLCYDEIKVDIPKAPGLGLMLEKLHFSPKVDLFGGPGISEERKSDIKKKVEDFKENIIQAEIIKTEIETASMMRWLQMLILHHYMATSIDGRNRSRNHKMFQFYQPSPGAEDDTEESGSDSEKGEASTSSVNDNSIISDELVEDGLVNEHFTDKEGMRMNEDISMNELNEDSERTKINEQRVRRNFVDSKNRKGTHIEQESSSQRESEEQENEKEYRRHNTG